VPPTPQDIRMLHEFSRCIVEARPNQSARVLTFDYRTDSYRRSLRNLATGPRHCIRLGSRFRTAGVLLAGAMAETLLPRALAGRTLADGLRQGQAGAPIAARDDGEYLGLCAVRTMPEDVSALLAAEPAGEEEKRAAAAIAPQLSPCVRQGAAATLNRPALRALLALAAYRIVSRQAPGAAAGES